MLFLTPTYPADFGRARLLQDGLERYNPEDRHLLVVADHDIAAARRELGSTATIVTLSEALPGVTRRLQRLSDVARKHLKVGWWLQQFVKLNVGRAFGEPSWVCLDSDSFPIATLAVADCYAEDGRPLLREMVGHSVGHHVVSFNAHSARMLHLAGDAASVERSYTGTCIPISGKVADDLLSWLEEHYRTPWWLTMATRQGTEYATYGMFSRHHNHLVDVVSTDRYVSIDIYARQTVDEVMAAVDDGRAGGKRQVMVHSRLGYTPEDVRAMAEAIWSS